jgi:hypothetical protein
LAPLGVDLSACPVVYRRAHSPDRDLVIGGQPAVAMEDRDGVCLIIRGEAVQLVECRHRFRISGEVVARVVLLCVLELARQRADREQDHQPNGDNAELGTPPAWQLGERAGNRARSLPHWVLPRVES